MQMNKTLQLTSKHGIKARFRMRRSLIGWIVFFPYAGKQNVLVLNRVKPGKNAVWRCRRLQGTEPLCIAPTLSQAFGQGVKLAFNCDSFA